MITATEYRALAAKTMTEADLQTQVIKLARTFGWLCFHTLRSKGSEPGFLDLTMARPGQLIFAELKTERGKTTPAQDRWLELLQSTDVRVFLWRPTSLLSGEIAEVLR